MMNLKTSSWSKGFCFSFFQQYKNSRMIHLNSHGADLLIPFPLKVLNNVSQKQSTTKTISDRLTQEVKNHLMSIRLLNQSLERYLDQVNGWKEVIEETEEKMKTLTEDQYEVKVTAQQINTTVALR